MASNTSHMVNKANILPPLTVQELVRDWLKEDTPNLDYGGFVVGDKTETAILLCKSEGVLAGVPFFNAIFKELDCTVLWYKNEGDVLKPISKIAMVTGPVCNLLLGERVALNVISRTSGVATIARRLSTLAKDVGWHGEIAGTRKTTPGFRLAEKYSLLVGGISTHRYDLSSMVMLKDNHIWSAGNITKAVKDAKSVCGFSTKIEVECRSVAEALEATKAGSDVVMLDNFEPEALRAAAKQIKDCFPHVIIEASGGITESNITHYMSQHVDVVSLSRTTQGYSVVNFSFKILKDGRDPENPIVNTL